VPADMVQQHLEPEGRFFHFVGGSGDVDEEIRALFGQVSNRIRGVERPGPKIPGFQASSQMEMPSVRPPKRTGFTPSGLSK